MLSDLIDLVLPRRCLGCGSAAGPMCPACVVVPEPFLVPVPGLTVWAATAYEGAVRTALVAYKERGRRDLARPLARLLSAAARPAARPVTRPVGGSGVVFVGVASSRPAARARGGDHVARLVRLSARALGHRSAQPLRQIRAVHDSAGLSASARRRNVAESMAATPPHRAGDRVLLIDDIVTTGATLVEAARALRAAGWAVTGAAVIAATPRRLAGSTAVPLAPPGSSV